MNGFDLFIIFFVYLYVGMLVAIMYDCDCMRTREERRRPLYQIALSWPYICVRIVFQTFRNIFRKMK